MASPPSSKIVEPETAVRSRGGLSRILIPWAAAVGLLYWALRGVSWSELLAACSDLEITEIAVLLAINVLALPLFGVRWWLICSVDQAQTGERKVSLFDTTLYRLAAFGLAYLTPGPLVGGEPLQVVLLERRHGFSRSQAIASVALDRVLELTVSFGALLAAGCYLLGVLSAGSGSAEGAALRPGLLALAVMVALPVGYLGLLARGRRPMSSMLMRFSATPRRTRGLATTLVESELLAANWLRQHPARFAAAVVVSLFGFLIIGFEFFLVVDFLGLTASLNQTLLAFVAARLAQFVFLPGALGALEASQLLSWRAAGVIDALGLAVSLVVRARDLLFALIGLGIGISLLRSVRKSQASYSDLRQKTSI